MIGQDYEPTVSFAGFLGDSDRAGRRRLYLTRELNYYGEFDPEDVLSVDTISAAAEPFLGQEATRLHLRPTARMEFTRTRSPRLVDDFDLDVITRRAAAQSRPHPTERCPSEEFCRTDVGFTCEGCPRTEDNCLTQNVECAPTLDNCPTQDDCPPTSNACPPDTEGECLSDNCQPF